jgi:galactose-1-phosphate uridylyltransferase
VGTIDFERAESRVLVRNPLRGFAAEEQRVEVRRDPILGATSILNPFLASKAGFFGENDRAFIARLAEQSAASCVFCGGALERRTAMYPDDLVPGGRLARGEATLLPNLFALAAYHPVIVLSRAHFLEPDGFTPGLLADGLALAREFLHCVDRRDRTAPYAFVGANYLLPAGASIVHPHLQMLAAPFPYTRHERLLDACRRHHEQCGDSLLDDLAREEERLGARFIGRRGRWRWFAAFAPQGCNEILAAHEEEADFAALDDGELGELAAGIAAVLGAYGRLGLLCFNFALFSVRHDLPAPGFRLFFRIVSRQNLSPAYRNDDYYLQKLLEADVVVSPPEELARLVRAAW